MNRRRFLNRLALAGLTSMPFASTLSAQQSDGDAIHFLDASTRKGIQLGLRYLSSQQVEDGSYSGSPMSRNVGVVGLATLAFMSAGNMPGRGPYGMQVTHGIEYLLNSTQENGLIYRDGVSGHGPMYGHGFATLCLAEVYGMAPDLAVRDKLADAVGLIVETQNEEGGWRYQPTRNQEADLSVTICQVMALRAAKNAGIYVPNETISRCTEYVKRCQNADGGFMYMASQPDVSRFPRSAAGIVSLYSAGIYKGPEIEKGLAYLMHQIPTGNNVREQSYFMYGHYYAVQAMWHAGGEHWQRWYPAIRDKLLARQRDSDNAWFSSHGTVYGTAMACLILQMPDSHLPIFQK